MNKYKYDVYKFDKKIISDISPGEVSEMIGMDPRTVCQYAHNGYIYNHMYKITRHDEEPCPCGQKEKIKLLREWDGVCMKLRNGRPRT